MSQSHCPRCGSLLPTHNPEGVCPACVFAELALPAADPSPEGDSSGDTCQGHITNDWRLEPGDTFGPYRVDRVIGRGGMGEVYEAEHIEQCRRVALKLLRQRFRRPDDRARFLAEGQLAAAVNHPNCVYVFETHEIAGIPVIAMELLPGGTLKDRVNEGGPLTPTQAVDAILQVVEGLDAAHAAGILHRDIKPSNCLVDRDGTIKIGDFGLSISIGSRDGGFLTKRMSFEGTPEFAPPEQIVGTAPDVRSDIYSVGATLYFLLTGRPPFEDADLDGLIAKIQTEPAKFPGDLQSRISFGLAELIRRCLAKQASQRPATYSDLKRELRRFSSDAVAPAPIGLRAMATTFDLVILFPIAGIVVGALVGSQAVRDPLVVVLVVVSLCVLYWSLLEGVFGVSYGKRRCGLAVVKRNGDPPGVTRALARAVLVVLPIAASATVSLLAKLVAGHVPPAAFHAGLFGLCAGVLALPARQGNGFYGLHDILTGTRVIKRSAVSAPARRPAPTPPLEQATGTRIGPYEVVSIVGTTDAQRVVLGWDPRLKRSVWIRVMAPGASELPSVVRNISRPTRLHWQQGQRSESGAWDAYESLDGQPLLALTNVQSWRSVSIWLRDLAHELALGTTDGSIDVLALDRVWITASDRAKLLDFLAPGLTEGESTPIPFDAASAQRFLYAAARRALGSAVPPLPLSVSSFLDALQRGQFSALSEIEAKLEELQNKPDRVTSSSRGMTLSLGVVVYLFGSDAIGRLLTNSVFPFLPADLASRFSLTVGGAGLIGSAVLGLFWAGACRGGAWLRAFGIAVVTPDGKEASRLRAVGRAAVAWSWVPVQLLFVAYGGPLLLIAVAKLAGLFYAADHPERGIQDRLAGTYLVPR